MEERMLDAITLILEMSGEHRFISGYPFTIEKEEGEWFKVLERSNEIWVNEDEMIDLGLELIKRGLSGK